jgi:aminoglycoside phosphotransferase
MMNLTSSTPSTYLAVGLAFGIGFYSRELLLPWCRKLQQANCEPRSTSAQKGSRPESSSNAQTPQQAWRLEPDARPLKPPNKDELLKGTVLASNLSRKVVRINSNTVAKFGSRVTLSEAEGATYIRRHTTIPVPRVIDAYSQDGDTFIIMEYVEGRLLSDVWDRIADSQKSVIVSELRGYISQMRRLIPPDAVLIGTIDGGPANDRRQGGLARGGPFRDEHQFIEWQLAQLRPEVPQSRRDIYDSMMKHKNVEHRIVFTHGDLGFHNVIVKDGHVSAIIDWEFSGWYPEHWDYCKSISFLASADDEYQACQEMYEEHYHQERFVQLWFNLDISHGGF